MLSLLKEIKGSRNSCNEQNVFTLHVRSKRSLYLKRLSFHVSQVHLLFTSHFTLDNNDVFYRRLLRKCEQRPPYVQTGIYRSIGYLSSFVLIKISHSVKGYRLSLGSLGPGRGDNYDDFGPCLCREGTIYTL